jgi:hypothetical protein
MFIQELEWRDYYRTNAETATVPIMDTVQPDIETNQLARQ